MPSDKQQCRYQIIQCLTYIYLNLEADGFILWHASFVQHNENVDTELFAIG